MSSVPVTPLHIPIPMSAARGQSPPPPFHPAAQAQITSYPPPLSSSSLLHQAISSSFHPIHTALTTLSLSLTHSIESDRRASAQRLETMRFQFRNVSEAHFRATAAHAREVYKAAMESTDKHWETLVGSLRSSLDAALKENDRLRAEREDDRYAEEQEGWAIAHTQDDVEDTPLPVSAHASGPDHVVERTSESDPAPLDAKLIAPTPCAHPLLNRKPQLSVFSSHSLASSSHSLPGSSLANSISSRSCSPASSTPVHTPLDAHTHSYPQSMRISMGTGMRSGVGMSMGAGAGSEPDLHDISPTSSITPSQAVAGLMRVGKGCRGRVSPSPLVFNHVESSSEVEEEGASPVVSAKRPATRSSTKPHPASMPVSSSKPLSASKPLSSSKPPSTSSKPLSSSKSPSASSKPLAMAMVPHASLGKRTRPRLSIVTEVGARGAVSGGIRKRRRV
ncbi:hypothetical protein BDV98DRAFT_120215 [Pterulicium gracile]|uniref:Uncharacterized protein n=1 Tax=Pterulicium gracile TaxID=1884261 RepID=A0A5C3QP40_9AGAR|nr:hypothetical protein BDV98DRAFT_120215 [Pterula gracilis]